MSQSACVECINNEECLRAGTACDLNNNTCIPQNLSDILKLTSKIASAATLGLSILAGMGSTGIAFSQSFYYLLFINVEYPLNYLQFLEPLNIALLNFFPNLFAIAYPPLMNETIKAPQNIENNGEMSGYFLKTGGTALSGVLASLVLYVLLTLMIKTSKDSFIHKLSKKALRSV
jgi:hypothetical protein